MSRFARNSVVEPSITVVMVITEASPRLLPSLVSAANYLSLLTKSSGLRGKLIFFNKSNDNRVDNQIKTLDSDAEILVLQHSTDKSLTNSISTLSELLTGNQNSWVQIVAEDDCIFHSNNFRFEPLPGFSMYLPSMIFLGKGVQQITPKILAGGVDSSAGLDLFNYGIEGDVSWHGLIREDVLVYFCRWLNKLEVQPNSISSASVWSALLMGRVGNLENFVYVKEASLYDSGSLVAQREEVLAARQFGDPDLHKRNGDIYTIYLLSLLQNSIGFGEEKNRKHLLKLVLLRYLVPAYISKRKGLKMSVTDLINLATRKFNDSLPGSFGPISAKANLNPDLTSIEDKRSV